MRLKITAAFFGGNMKAIIWYVIPCYNEQEVIEETATRLVSFVQSMIASEKISEKSRILLVDDGSADLTWHKICTLSKNNPIISALKLSANRGHQNALLAGLMTARKYADAAISMDADLQDDICASKKMIECFYEGNEIVYGVRKSRKTDTFFKRITAQLFYKAMKLLGTNVIYNHADYRLMGKKALNALSEYKEVNLFLRGIVPQLGFKCCSVEYDRGERFAGKSKYPFRKMLSFASEGITSFSIRPIKIAGFFGSVSILVSIIMLIYCIYEKFAGRTVPGWSSLGASIWAVGGIQLFIIGIIGEYIGKIYFETKQRPRYTIDEEINLN